MYNLEIGRKLLEIYNEANPITLSAKEFFDQVMFPVFFDTEIDSLHLMSGGNSAFGQPAYAKKERGSQSLGHLRREIFRSNVNEVLSGERNIGYSTLVGFSADDLDGTTTGQVSHLKGEIGENEVYYTWIGAACGIGIAGGFNLLIDSQELLNYLFNGWFYYRRFLNENTSFKGRQVETWNGLWVLYGFGATDFEESYRRVIDKLPEHQGITAKKESNLAERPDWFQIFLGFVQSKKLPYVLNTYAYKHGQMNTTLGFLRLELEPIKTLTEIFSRLLGETYTGQYQFAESQAELRKIFKAHYTLLDMVGLGGITMRTLRPAKVEAFMKANKPLATDNNFHYRILIKSWIIAMLNNDQLADLARDLGLALHNIETNSRENATTKIEALLNVGSKTAFIVAANELKVFKGVIDAKNADKKQILEAAIQVLKKAEDAAQRQIPIDQLSLFKALAKSDYLMAKYFPSLELNQLS